MSQKLTQARKSIHLVNGFLPGDLSATLKLALKVALQE